MTYLKRKVISPVDLEANNEQYKLAGIPYSGAASLDEFLLWRPSAEYKGHNTPVKNLYQIGASNAIQDRVYKEEHQGI